MTSRRAFLARSAALLAAAGLQGCGRTPRPPGDRRGVAAAPSDPLDGGRAGEIRTVAGVQLCWCPAGSFSMGSPPTEANRRSNEEPVRVTLTRGFWMARHEATQGEWRSQMGAWPDRPPTQQFGEGDDIPMYWVSYDQASAFCEQLTRRARLGEGLPEAWAFRIPSEAQWEYACRAGTSTAYAFGETIGREQANVGPELPEGVRAPAEGRSLPVGSYPPNAWGIHDMHGNVWEWCRDWYHARLPGGTDPDLSTSPGMQNSDGSRSRVRRGGAWIEEMSFCRSAARLPYEPYRGSDHIGFRVSLSRV